MKKMILLAATLMLGYSGFAHTWNLDKAHSKLSFTITHMMVNDVEGMFKDVDAKIQATKPDFSDAVVTMTAKTASINTDNDQRDEHLRGADYFDATNYPTITFSSKSIQKSGDKKYALTGDLTMHGITKTVTLDMVFRGQLLHPMLKKQVAGFKITGAIKRSDFKVGESSPMLGDEVVITANGEFVQE